MSRTISWEIEWAKGGETPREKFMLDPKPDITAYELALLWAMCKMEIDAALLEAMPEEVRRHFRASIYNHGPTN